jgi:hypothetical protein
MAPISQLPFVPESARNLTAVVSKQLGYYRRLKAVFFKSRGGNVARVQEFSVKNFYNTWYMIRI